jgi:transcription-repair coupling factor (superfamily II helicase)
MQRIVPPELYRLAAFQLSVGGDLARDSLVRVLDAGGYQRSTLVEETGQMAVRGAVVDFFPPGVVYPIRVELFADTVQSVRTFDPSSQRSLSPLERFEILPIRELFLPSNPDAADLVSKRLRARASELALPLSAAKTVEEAMREGMPLPGLEHLQPLLVQPLATLWDYFSADRVVYVCDEPAVLSAADELEAIVYERAERAQVEGRMFPVPESAYASAEEIHETLRRETDVFFDLNRLVTAEDLSAPSALEPAEKGGIEFGEERRSGVFTLAGLSSALRAARHHERPFLPLAEELRHRLAQGYKVAVVVSHPSRERRVIDLLAGYELSVHVEETGFGNWVKKPVMRSVSVLHGELRTGLRSTELRVMLIPEQEIFPEIRPRKTGGAAKSVRRFLGSVSQLKEDDYVVHLDHGIAVYRGLRQIDVDGKTGDFLHLEYADQAKLFVPVENIGKVQKYAGADAKKPALSKLGGKAWQTTKTRVRENVAELAGQLIKILAERELAPGMSFGPPDADDATFADTFPFEETPDQTKAIAEVLGDLSKARPMDRLVCGDVGYGKTEVALRAAFKVVNSGKQVALLVPTTILADQHYNTFRARFADSPFRVGCLSRFNTPAENKELLVEVNAGRVDVVIGTHRLLQKDVLFKDLGMLIIDEEHRFGVAHKEKLKRLRAEVHVLTLTATPIPRTLHQSLVGIRDLSIIETPPVNRQLIRTYLATYSDAIVREAVVREISRSGQVFYIHNRVDNIAAIADEVSELVPEAKVAFAHGQMKEAQLEEVMHRFVTGEVNVLVSTTIVESGLDIANANTIIIRHADKFGLAELYQLRGRVGRSARRAYAYLLIPDPKTLGPDAKRRLQVLQSLDDLGIGFRLALQDMEIRGAGNLLGKDQSGHIDLVGYELYSRILKEAVEELRSRKISMVPVVERPRPIVDPEVRIGFPAHIPPWYVPDVAERLLLYQRLIELRDEDDGLRVLEEISDRFGTQPVEVDLLIELMVFRGLLRRGCAVSASYRNGTVSIGFHPQAAPDPQRVVQAIREYSGALRMTPAMNLNLSIPQAEVESPKDLTSRIERLFAHLGVLL